MSFIYDYALPLIYNTLFIYILLNGLSNKKWIDIPIRLFVICPLAWSISHAGYFCLFSTTVIAIIIIYKKFFGEKTGGY